jgi:hypothetical protein
MGLGRGVLASIDRRVFAELDHHRGIQAVKVPASGALWSTWRRYCEALGLTMGEAIAGLIDHELRTVVTQEAGEPRGVFVGRARERFAAQESEAAARERRLASAEERLQGWEQRLAAREAALREQETKIQAATPLPVVQSAESGPKVGRNERCPCRSGLKYKHCHDLPGRQDGLLPR